MPTLSLRFFVRLTIALSLLSATVWGAPGPNTNSVRRAFGKSHPFAVEDLPAGKLKSGVQALPPPAQDRAKKWLHSFEFSERDAAEHLRVDRNGGIYIVCPDDQGNYEGHKAASKSPTAQGNNAAMASNSTPMLEQAGGPITENAPTPVTNPPAYHSRPGAPNVIYLDFNGGVVSNTSWNSSRGVSSWSVAPYTSDADTNTFSDAEQTWMRRVWERISEDYAPFNVDVTTDVAFDPDSTGGRNNVGWIIICNTNDANGVTLPTSGVGGVAYVGVFGNANYSPTYQPAWVNSKNGGGNEAIVAEAASHEMGHNMGLSHDGTSAGGLTYYGGFTATANSPSWGPIMGTGYSRNVSQWSKGEYYDANQLQDDLAIISARISYMADDYGNTFATATPWVTTNSAVSQTGLIERTDDIDVFKFTTGAGAVSLNANPYKCDADTWGGNLDISLELYDSTYTLVASNNPAVNVTASISTNLAAGAYYLMVRPVGTGYPMNNPPDGYTSYGSLGRYTITGNIIPTGNMAGAGTSLVAESCQPTNGVLDPGELITVQFAIQNIGSLSTTNLVATLLATNGVTPITTSQTYGVLPNGGAAVSRPFTFMANGNCGDTITAILQLQDGTNNYGQLVNSFVLGLPSGLITNNYSSGGVAVAIPDSSTVDIPITVPDSGNISNVIVKVRLNHTYDSDLILALVHPDGTTVALANNRGSSGDNFGSGNPDCSGTFTVFNDAAGTTIASGTAPFAGSFQPESPLAALKGKPYYGTWKLRVQDTAAQDTGTVYCVQLDVARLAGYACCSGGPSYKAALVSLIPSAGIFSPAFTFNNYSYTSSVPFKTNSLTLTPTPVDTNATITINGSPVAYGNSSSTMSLNVGANVINTVVVSQDMSVTNTYTLTVTRTVGGTNALLANLAPSAGTLNPTFASGTFNYTDNVPYSASNLTVTPTATDTNAIITVNGNAINSGNPSGVINLDVGTNLITTVVISEDRSATNTYTIAVIRAVGGTSATLANLAPSAGTLNPTFTSGTFTYTFNVTFATFSLTVRPTATDTNATIAVNGSPVASGNLSGTINLNIGTNFITTVVVAEDRSITNIYTLTVIRAAANNGIYTQTNSGGLWFVGTNWSGGIAAGGTNSTADFSTLNLTADNTVRLDFPVTVGSLIFGDTDTNTAAAWTLDNNGNSANTLTLAGGTPSITVNTLGGTKTTTLSAVIAGSTPWSKLGIGTLTLSGANTYTAATTVSNGTLQISSPYFNVGRTTTIASGAVLDLRNSANTLTTQFPVSLINGAGIFRLSGNTIVNQFSGGSSNQKRLTIGLAAGSVIDLQDTAQLVNGGWQNLVWTTNQASLNIAAGAKFDIWDGNPVYVDALTGAGTVDKGYAGSHSLNIGVVGGAGTFSGTIKNTTGTLLLTKAGTGTQILSGTNTYTGPTTVNGGTLLINGNSSAVNNTVTVTAGAAFGGTGTIGGVVRYQANALAQFTVGRPMTFTNSVFMTNVTVKVDLGVALGNGVYVLATNTLAAPTVSGSLTLATNSGSLGTNGIGVVSVSGNNLILTVSGAISTTPTITGATNFVSAFTTTYGTASAAQTYVVTGTNLISDITNSAAPGFEVSGNGGATYSSTVIATNVSGTASNLLYIRLSATATAGTYNSSNLVVLTSAVARSITNTSSASGNVVNKAASVWSYSNTGPFAFNGTAKTPAIGFSGSANIRTTNYVGTGSTTYVSVNAPTNVGTYYVSNSVTADSNYLGATNSQAFAIKAPGNFSGIGLSGTTLTLNVTNGTPGATWTLLQSTNLQLPVAQWKTNRTGTYDGSGNFFTNILNSATNPLEFFLLK